LLALTTTPLHIENDDIAGVCAAADGWIASHWQLILDANASRLAATFMKAGDMAYGTYLGMLLRPVMRALTAADLAVYPRLPGSFADSREWGNADESEQQRWFFSSVVRLSGDHLGMLVTVVHHDHRRFRVPHRPQMFAAAVPFRLLRSSGAINREEKEPS
jgi:hypothetical protein